MKKSVIFILVLFFGVATMMAAGSALAGPGSVAVKLVQSWVTHYADDVARLGGREAAEEMAEQAVARYGDEALLLLKKSGPQGLRLLKRYGDEAIAWTRAGGEEALQVMARPSFEREILPVLRRGGPELIGIEARTPGTIGSLVRSYGSSGALAAKNLSPANVVRFAQAGPALEKMGRAEDFSRLVSRFGDEVFAVIEKALAVVGKHPKGAVIGLGFAYVLSNPETMNLFVGELARTPGEVAKEVVRLFATDKVVSQNADGSTSVVWSPPYGLMILVGAPVFFSCCWLLSRRRVRKF